jgi:ribulose-phosphate 3-epimerase
MKIAPSMLACDFSNISKEITMLNSSCADFIHLDIMDGCFVPNISFGSDIVKSMRNLTELPFDVHLMVSDPDKHINNFAEAGADIITFHVEASKNIENTINLIKMKHKKVGISVKPGTNIEKIYPYIKDLDLILIMTVEPGFGGQKFMPQMIDKIKNLKNYIKTNKLVIPVEVDGGINFETIKIAESAGADIAVAGSSVFLAHEPLAAIKMLKST